MPTIAPVEPASKSGPGWIKPAMWHALFGGDAPKGASDVKPYALVDGAVWASLTGDLQGVLADANLPNRNLFQGEAAEEFGEDAPFLVDLTLRDDAVPTGLHKLLFDPNRDPAVGFFFRSDAGIDALQNDFRKLTRVQDNDDSWYFVRYWEPEYFIYLVSFMQDTRLLAYFAKVDTFVVPLADDVVQIDGPFAPPAPADYDRDYELDRLFDAGAAMVAIRHARDLEEEHKAGCDPDTVFETFRSAFEGYALDYTDLASCIEIVYVLYAVYGDRADQKLTDAVMGSCFDEDGEMKMFFEYVHGQCMFALKQGLDPHRLPFKGGIT